MGQTSHVHGESNISYALVNWVDVKRGRGRHGLGVPVRALVERNRGRGGNYGWVFIRPDKTGVGVGGRNQTPVNNEREEKEVG